MKPIDRPPPTSMPGRGVQRDATEPPLMLSVAIDVGLALPVVALLVSLIAWAARR